MNIICIVLYFKFHMECQKKEKKSDERDKISFVKNERLSYENDKLFLLYNEIQGRPCRLI